MTIEEIDKLRDEARVAVAKLDITLHQRRIPDSDVLACLAILRKLAR